MHYLKVGDKTLRIWSYNFTMVTGKIDTLRKNMLYLVNDIEKLKRCRSPGTDEILSELI